MSIANASATINERGLGQAAQAGTTPVLLGLSSSGTANTPTLVTSLADAQSTFGYGPLVDLVGLYLAITGKPVIAVRVAQNANGTRGSVTHTGTGSSVMTTSGTPYDSFWIGVKITSAGTNPAAGTARMRVGINLSSAFSPDAMLAGAEWREQTRWGQEIAVPTSGVYLVPGTNVTVTFSAASLVEGDIYELWTTAPTYTSTELENALDTLNPLTLAWEFAHVVGPSDADLFASVEAMSDALAADNRFHWFLLDARLPDSGESDSDWAAALLDSTPGFDGLTASRGGISVGAGSVLIRSSTRSGTAELRPASWSIGPRCGAIRVSEHPGRVRSGTAPEVILALHDLREFSQLDTGRFCGLQTISGRGRREYFATGSTFAAVGSDLGTIPRARVMCLASNAAMQSITEYVNDTVELNADGTIAEAEAQRIEAEVLDDMQAALMRIATGPHVSSCAVVVDRAWDVGATDMLLFEISCVPLGYATQITVKLGFKLSKGN